MYLLLMHPQNLLSIHSNTGILLLGSLFSLATLLELLQLSWSHLDWSLCSLSHSSGWDILHACSVETPWTVGLQAPLSMDFPGKNTGADCHALLQGILPTQGSNPSLLHLLRWQGFPGGLVVKSLPGKEFRGF